MEVIRKDGSGLASITIINGDDNLLVRPKGLVGLWETIESSTVKEWTINSTMLDNNVAMSHYSSNVLE
jgi:hypothetical protein